MIQENLVKYFNDSIHNNWEKPAFADYNGETLTYAEVANKILKTHAILNHFGIKKGDKVALIGKNSTNWAITLLSVISYGAVIVPILPDFMPGDVQHIVNHSDSVLFFSSEPIFETLKAGEMKAIRAVVSVNSLEVLYSPDGKKEESKAELKHVISGFDINPVTRDKFKLPEVGNENLAIISYTSGTTGNSKGVMLLHNSLAANLRFAQNNMPLKSGDNIVSFLPLAHAYGLAFEFLFPFTLGCFVTFLTKTPSPQIIMQAFSEIKPRLVLSVPLVIEKIYKKKVLPTISKPAIKFLLAVPGINILLRNSIRKKLSAAFGGNFHEIVIGGAAFNAEAEAFFRKIKFRYTVGYGMTECGPLISYASWDTTKVQSSGRSVDTLDVRIDSEDPENIVGEIIMKGENVMVGYYKNEEATKASIDEDGWLHSGDLGLIDKDGFVYIKGRSKSMLLGASGQNIYPEEIESVLNNMHYVLESLIIQDESKLKALIVVDKDAVVAEKVTEDKLQEIMKANIKELNKQVPAYMNISKFELRDEEFEKTPKRSIRRFLYDK
ncbi:MAG: AMP-binding protein [Bacteroidales bacterium]|nr:AMP-binding protein [Bacteroidales bacterium]MBN2819155.1 AMP-binding protein [Bacteroidales bacterium]